MTERLRGGQVGSSVGLRVMREKFERPVRRLVWPWGDGQVERRSEIRGTGLRVRALDGWERHRQLAKALAILRLGRRRGESHDPTNPPTASHPRARFGRSFGLGVRAMTRTNPPTA